MSVGKKFACSLAIAGSIGVMVSVGGAMAGPPDHANAGGQGNGNGFGMGGRPDVGSMPGGVNLGSAGNPGIGAGIGAASPGGVPGAILPANVIPGGGVMNNPHVDVLSNVVQNVAPNILPANAASGGMPPGLAVANIVSNIANGGNLAGTANLAGAGLGNITNLSGMATGNIAGLGKIENASSITGVMNALGASNAAPAALPALSNVQNIVSSMTQPPVHQIVSAVAPSAVASVMNTASHSSVLSSAAAPSTAASATASGALPAASPLASVLPRGTSGGESPLTKQIQFEQNDRTQIAPSVNITTIGYGYRLIPFGFEQDNDSLIVADQNAVFEKGDEHHITLKQGTLIAFPSDRAIIVGTTHGDVVIPAGSVGGVTQKRHGGMSIASLAGKPVTFNANRAETRLQVSVKEQLDINSTEIATAGTSDFVKNADSGQLPGLSVARSEVGGNNIFFERLTKADRTSLSQSQKRKLRGLIQDMVAADSSLAAPPESAAESRDRERVPQHTMQYRPIAFTSFGAFIKPAQADEVRTVDGDVAKLTIHGDSDIGANERDTIVLNGGEVMVEAHKNTNIELGETTLTVPKDTVLLITRFAGQSTIRVLWDTSSKPVAV
jgi:hypothetical protein